MIDVGEGPLTESMLVERVHPLFSRVLKRNEIYLSNHSLGRPLDRTALDLQEAMDLWYTDLDGAWKAWFEAIAEFRRRVGMLLGVEGDQVVPKPGAGQGLRAVLNALDGTRPNIVTTTNEFDSVDCILKAYAQKKRASVEFVPVDENDLVDPARVADAINEDTDLVVVSRIYFSSGQDLDIDEIVRRAHEHEALVVLDTYHAAGVIPLDMGDIDFCIGGNYKYTRGGPGAGWLAIHPRHLDRETLDTGWFAKKDVFGFQRGAFERAEGGDAWMECTPVVMTAYQAKAGLELTLDLGVDRLREYSLRQKAMLAAELQRRDVMVRDEGAAFMLIPHDDATRLHGRLKVRGVNTDARHLPSGRECVRVCPDILNTEDELVRAAEIIASAM